MTKVDGVFEVLTEATIKVDAIPLEGLRWSEFARFQKELRGCALPDAVVLE